MVEVVDGIRVVGRSVRRFALLPRVGDEVIVRPDDQGPRLGLVRSVVHSSAGRAIGGMVLLRVAVLTQQLRKALPKRRATASTPEA